MDYNKNNSYQPIAKAEMLIRKPVTEVFEAMINPEITSKFWFTKSSGRIEAGKEIIWQWEMYNVSQKVSVKDVQENKSISFLWGEENAQTTVEMIFTSRDANNTFLSITEKGFNTENENIIPVIVGQTEGWTIVLAALKCLLEHNIILTLVHDRHPDLKQH